MTSMSASETRETLYPLRPVRLVDGDDLIILQARYH